jgi:hypothetical protein
VGCQGDTPAPVALDRTLEGAPAIKCPWGTSVTDIYENKFKSDKTAACKDAAEFVDARDLAAAELVINQLLVALYNDYAACVGGPFGTQDPDTCPFADGASVDPAGVVAFARETCGIAPEADLPTTDDVDCVVPTVENLSTTPALPTDPTDGTDAGWIVVGPVGEEAIVVLPNDEFGIQIDNLKTGVTEVFVAMRENEPTPINRCPDASQGCVRNNYTIDMDGVGQLFADNNDPIGDGLFDLGLYVEICEGTEDDFASVSVPARCSGGACARAQPTDDRELTGCSKGALAFAPSTWSAVDPTRDVQCVVTSRSAAVSEGTTCTIFPRGSNDPVDSCPTLATPDEGPKMSACTIPDVLAANLDDANDPSPVLYTMEANKIENGVSHFGSTDFELSQTDPIFGIVEDVPVDVRPPGQQ